MSAKWKSPKLNLLKELAKRRLLEKKEYLAYDAYGKLWDEIDVTFNSIE